MKPKTISLTASVCLGIAVVTSWSALNRESSTENVHKAETISFNQLLPTTHEITSADANVEDMDADGVAAEKPGEMAKLQPIDIPGEFRQAPVQTKVNSAEFKRIEEPVLKSAASEAGVTDISELEMPILTEKNPQPKAEPQTDVKRYEHQLSAEDMAHLLATETETIRIGGNSDDTTEPARSDMTENKTDDAVLPVYPSTQTITASNETESVVEGIPMQAEVLRIVSSPADQSPDQIPDMVEEKPSQQPAANSAPVTETRQPLEETAEIASFDRRPVRVPAPIQKRVEERLEYGRSLARRGSAISARNEFVNGLKLIAQVWDYETKTTDYSQSLSKGLIALKEAKDFFDRDRNINDFVNPKNIIQSHQSKVLTTEQAADASRADVLQKYLLYSQRHLVDACGNSPLAAELLYSLGKLHLSMNTSGDVTAGLSQAKAMVLFRSAYSVDRDHSGAGNELAVILAKNGHLQMAKKLLVNCARVNPTPIVWKNLAHVHRSLNENDFAVRAMNEYQLTQRLPNANRIQTHPVNWVTPKQFNKIQVGPVQNVTPAVAGTLPSQANPPKNQGKSFGAWPAQNQGAVKPRTAGDSSLGQKILKKIF